MSTIEKVDPFARMRPARQVHRIEAIQPADENGPEVKVVLLVREQDIPDAYRVSEAAGRLIRKYVETSDRSEEHAPGEDEKPVEPLVNRAGQRIRVTETMCRDAASVFVMQSPVDEGGSPRSPEEFYSEDDMLGFLAFMSIAWLQLKLKAAQINRGGDGEGKAAPGSDSSGPASQTEQPTIPSS